MKRLLFLLLWPLFAHAAPPIGYTQCAAENASCTLQSSGYVTYGADTHYSPAKHFAAGSVACNNTTFAPDPDVNVVKACYFVSDANVWSLLQGTTLISMSADATTCRSAAKAQVVKVTTTFTCQNTTVTNANPTVDTKTTDTLFSVITLAVASTNMAAMGPTIDKTKIPVPVSISASGPYGYVPLNFGDKHIAQVPLNSNGSVVTGYDTEPSDIGAFRESCNFSHMLFDDPIVFPSQPGKSHLHTFFGAHDGNAYTTAANIRTEGGGSTCAGGELNRTLYWVPSMIDTATNTPIVPSANLVYYKGSYLIPNNDIITLPAGLKMITGDSTRTTGSADHNRFICMGPNGENPGWSGNIAQALAAAALVGNGGCVGGSDFIIEVDFPICWDGVNLDSPNHNSHMSDTVQIKTVDPKTGVISYPSSCPVTHPKHIPTISYNIHYSVPTNGAKAVALWKLSSDQGEPGASAHGDYEMGWEPTTMQKFVTNCLNKLQDGHSNLLCNGEMLTQP